MPDHLRDVLGPTLELAQRLAREDTRPDEAQLQLHRLRREHPELEFELVWEEEAYDGSVHYDLLIRRAGAGTISLSFCPERVLPWPLRGSQRSSERALLRVNATVLPVDRVVACLDFIWDEVPIMTRLIDACLIHEALNREAIELSAAELQDAMDAFRRGHQLYTAAQTRAWMERRSLTHRQLECLVADQAAIARLREHVAAGRVAAYFAAHRSDFDTARIARIDMADVSTAERLASRIRAGTSDFYAAAEQAFLSGGHRETTIHEVVRRGELAPALGAAIFDSREREVVGPIQTDRGWSIVRVIDRAPAVLDDTIEQVIVRRIFADWLAERRAAARIEWLWGNASRTEGVA